jgi:thiol-disulfide isomerase/thioredoxin
VYSLSLPHLPPPAVQINADRVAVIYFWAYWCGPCRGMTPIFNGVADSGSLAGVDFYRVDIDHANDIVQHVGGQTVRGLTLFRIHPHPPPPTARASEMAVSF